MKKKYYILSFIMLLTNFSFGQQLIWNSLTGGDNSNGAVISYDLGTNQLSTLASLEGNFLRGLTIHNIDNDYFNDRTVNSGGLIPGSNGNLYGISALVVGGAYEARGALYKLNPSTGAVEMLHYFPGINLPNASISDREYSSFGREIYHPVLGLIEATNNKLYGIASRGGEYNKGGIYCYDLTAGSYEKVADFDTLLSGLGNTPVSPLIEGPNGDLFGVLHTRGNNVNSDGYLYKVEIATNTVSIVANLAAAGWAIYDPVQQIAYNPSENKIYGTKQDFGGVFNAGAGVYSYNFNTATVTNEAIITATQSSTLGEKGNGMAPLANDGNLYFTTKHGGSTGKGTLLKYNTTSKVITLVHTFSHNVNGNGMIVSGDYIYGTYDFLEGGSLPLIWSYNVSTQIFADVATATSVSTIGDAPQHHIAIIGNEIYGHNMHGIGSDVGSIFKVNRSSSLSSVVQANQSEEGRGLMGDILIEGDSIAYTHISTGGLEASPGFYSEQGGTAKIDLINGTVKLDTALSAHLFGHGITRNEKYTRLLKSSSGKYYSSVVQKLSNGGDNGYAVQIDPITGAYTTIRQVAVVKELYNTGFIEYQTGKIAFAIGDSLHVYDEGTQSLSSHILSLNTNESAYNNLLLGSNGNIYFRTIHFGSGLQTSIYAVDTSTWISTNIHSFTDAYEHNNGLIEVNGKLYGSTIEGGTNDEGYLYSVDINNGNTFAIEHNFNANVDGGGFIGEWVAYNGKLYGVSFVGGSNGYGTLAEFDVATSTLTVLENLDMSNGNAYKASPSLWDDSILAVNEIDSKLSIKIYPNPTQSVLFIDEAQVESVEVYSLNGKLLLDQKGSSKINVSNLSSGTYILKITNDKGTFSSKFIKK